MFIIWHKIPKIVDRIMFCICLIIVNTICPNQTWLYICAKLVFLCRKEWTFFAQKSNSQILTQLFNSPPCFCCGSSQNGVYSVYSFLSLLTIKSLTENGKQKKIKNVAVESPRSTDYINKCPLREKKRHLWICPSGNSFINHAPNRWLHRKLCLAANMFFWFCFHLLVV